MTVGLATLRLQSWPYMYITYARIPSAHVHFFFVANLQSPNHRTWYSDTDQRPMNKAAGSSGPNQLTDTAMHAAPPPPDKAALAYRKLHPPATGGGGGECLAGVHRDQTGGGGERGQRRRSLVLVLLVLRVISMGHMVSGVNLVLDIL